MNCRPFASRFLMAKTSVVAALFLCLPAPQIAAQVGGSGGEPRISSTTNPTDPMNTDERTKIIERERNLVVHVVGEDKQRLDRQAVVKLTNEERKTVTWQTTTERSEADFIDLPIGKYNVEVSAVGFFTGHTVADIQNPANMVTSEVLMERDPSAIDLDAADANMSPKASKEMKRAVKALKAGDLKQGQKRLQNTEKLAPSSPQLKFLFGYLYFQKKDFDAAQKYLSEAATINPRYSQALILLGRVQLLRQQYGDASKNLEKAVEGDPDNWMAYNLLADSYFKQQQYQKAAEEAQLAVDKGRRDGAAAQLVLGQALANLGRTPQAIAALEAYLDTAPKSATAPQAQELLRQLQQHQKIAAGASTAASETVIFKPVGDEDFLGDSKLPDTAWQPPSIDRAPPPVAKGAPCPVENVIGGAGRGVEQFVDDIARFAAIEDLLHERLDDLGNPTTKDTRKFDYAASISQPRPGTILVDEYRSEHYGMETLPDYFADKGFAALALVFHPAMRDEFQMECEGLGEWHGQATWLVHFRQRSDRPNHIQAYLVGNNTYPVSLKGRAWVTADKLQIIRIETEMINPLPEIHLLAEHQITEYGPVPFGKKKVELWLPKTAEVYMHFRGRRYYRKHTFEKYMLFSVDETQKDREAKHEQIGPGSTSPHKHKWWRAQNGKAASGLPRG